MGDYTNIVQQRFYNIKGEYLDEDALGNIVSIGENESVLQKAIQEKGRGHIHDSINEIHEQHDAVKEIDQSLLELHQFFLYMVMLVEAQGEQLNYIQYNISHSSNYDEHGTKQIYTAIKHNKRS